MAAQGSQDDGATPRELVLEASRRNNTDLLQEVIHTVSKSSSSTTHTPEQTVAALLNTAVDGIGNHCLHLAATHGSYETLDLLLDQEGLEVDPLDRLEADTPLHKAVRFVNALEPTQWDGANALVELLLDAGADPRSRNRAKLRPFDLVDPANKTLREVLQKAEFMIMAGTDIINGDEDDKAGGSASDSN